MILILSEKQIKAHWDHIKSDPYNGRPETETFEEYISEIWKGNVTAGGATIMISDEMPPANT